MVLSSKVYVEPESTKSSTGNLHIFAYTNQHDEFIASTMPSGGFIIGCAEALPSSSASPSLKVS